MRFECHGIKIDIEAKLVVREILDGKKDTIKRTEREITASTYFFNYSVKDKDLTTYAFIKSVLQTYTSLYKSSQGKIGYKIDLDETIHQTSRPYGMQSLQFASKQKSGINSLYICQKNDNEKVWDVYLRYHEVLMLDIALGKVISMMGPSRNQREEAIDDIFANMDYPPSIKKQYLY